MEPEYIFAIGLVIIFFSYSYLETYYNHEFKNTQFKKIKAKKFPSLVFVKGKSHSLVNQNMFTTKAGSFVPNFNISPRRINKKSPNKIIDLRNCIQPPNFF